MKVQVWQAFAKMPVSGTYHVSRSTNSWREMKEFLDMVKENHDCPPYTVYHYELDVGAGFDNVTMHELDEDGEPTYQPDPSIDTPADPFADIRNGKEVSFNVAMPK